MSSAVPALTSLMKRWYSWLLIGGGGCITPVTLAMM